MEPGTVIDIGGSNIVATMKSMIEERMLRSSTPEGISHLQRVLPSALLSDETGLAFWKQINRLPTYYQTSEEILLLEENRWELVQHIVSGSSLIDLGMGDIRKVKPLLDALEESQIRVNYYALDLSYNAIQSQIYPLSTVYTHVRCFGLWGTFEDGLRWILASCPPPSCSSIQTKQQDTVITPLASGPRFFLSLGSVLGNDWFYPAVGHLKKWSQAMRPQDRMLLGMDATSNMMKLWSSYHDEQGLFTAFIRNGMMHTNRVLGREWYRDEDWEVEGSMQTEEPIMHCFMIRALKDVVDEEAGVYFSKGDEIECYEAFKYGPDIIRRQCAMAGLVELRCWKAPGSQIYEYLLSAQDLGNDAQDLSNNNRYFVK